MKDSSNASVSVLLVSASRSFQDNVGRLLQRQEGLSYIGSGASLDEAAAMIQSGPAPDVIVSNLLPADAADALAWRRLADQGPRLLMLATYVRDRDVILSVLAGASGYLPAAGGRGPALLDAILRVGRGQQITPEASVSLLESSVVGQTDGLGFQERILLDLIAKHRTDQQIARETGMDLGQVHQVLMRLFDAESSWSPITDRSRLSAHGPPRA